MLLLYGLAATTLRCLSVSYDSTANHRVYLTEPPPAGWPLPAGGRWIAVSDLDRLTFAVPAHRDLIRSWMADTRSVDGPPWYRPGWFGRAAAWIGEQLALVGRAATGPIEQLRSWERSSLLRVPTAEGWVYFKAVPPVFAHEVALLSSLAGWHPASVPQLLALDQAHHWLLMDEFDGSGLDTVTDPARWEAALVDYAALQVACIAHHDQLLALGCPASPLAALPAGYAALLRDDTAMLRGAEGRMTADEIARLHGLMFKIAGACDDLAHVGMPMTLEHGDLWAGNIVARTDGGYRYFDWSDSAVTHPFFSLPIFLDDAAAAFPSDPTIRAGLCDAYLRAWSPFVAPGRAQEAFGLAQRLAPLHHALTYQQRILPAMRARWEMERMVPFYLRMLLARWEEA